MICKRCRVTGRVQGVFYRGSCAEQARRLGITGHARNLADGTVEVLACGPADVVDALVAWLAIGPPAARVVAVRAEEEDLPVPPPDDFSVG